MPDKTHAACLIHRRHLSLALLAAVVVLFACQPAPAGEFAIYLLDQPLSAAQADALPLAQRPLRAEPVLSSADLVRYDAATHEMFLTGEAYQRATSLQVPVRGLPFVVCVGPQRIYGGAFWTPISSMSYNGITIWVLQGSPGTSLAFERGYPGESFFSGADPRADPRVLEALRRAGKLD